MYTVPLNKNKIVSLIEGVYPGIKAGHLSLASFFYILFFMCDQAAVVNTKPTIS